MNLTLEFSGFEPISLNHAIKYRVAGKFVQSYKSAGYKQLESLVNSQIKKHKSALRKFNNAYVDGEHYIVAEYRFYYPIMTKKGTISKLSKDIDNTIKTIQDAIFKHLSPDDSQIINLSATKIHSEKPFMIIEYQLESIKHL